MDGMRINSLLMCLQSVNPDLKIREVKPNCIYFTHTPKMFKKDKMCENYIRIINGEEPLYYKELYRE